MRNVYHLQGILDHHELPFVLLSTVEIYVHTHYEFIVARSHIHGRWLCYEELLSWN